MVNLWYIIIMMILCANISAAKDLGVYGQVFSIKEHDLLEVIQTKLKLMESSGQIATEQQNLAKKTYEALTNPIGIDLPRCKTTRSYKYDPSFYWPTDLRDHNGKIFYQAFTKMSPFDFIVETTRHWILLDGQDPKQITWIKQQGLNSGKLILVKGSAIKLMQELQVPIYFDTGAKIIKKLAIQALPAIVELKNKQITITEVAVDLR